MIDWIIFASGETNMTKKNGWGGAATVMTPVDACVRVTVRWDHGAPDRVSVVGSTRAASSHYAVREALLRVGHPVEDVADLGNWSWEPGEEEGEEVAFVRASDLESTKAVMSVHLPTWLLLASTDGVMTDDTAVARRVLRRIAGASPRAVVREVPGHEMPRHLQPWDSRRLMYVRFGEDTFDAAISGARAGREYAARLRRADADAAHARVEGHMLDRQIAHLTKGSK